MIKVMMKLILIVVSLSSAASLAAWTSPIEISEIVAEGSDTGSAFIIIFSSTIGVDPAVGTCSGVYHYLNASTEKGKMMYSMFLTAKTADKPVKVSLIQGGSVDRCEISGARY